MKQKFKKLGGGTMRLTDGRKIKPGEVFTCDPSIIPVSFMDLLQPIVEIPEKQEEKKEEEKPASNTPKRTKTTPKKEPVVSVEVKPCEEEEGLFDVYLIQEGEEDIKINDVPLTEVDAQELKVSMS